MFTKKDGHPIEVHMNGQKIGEAISLSWKQKPHIPLLHGSIYDTVHNTCCGKCGNQVDWTLEADPDNPYWVGECCGHTYVARVKTIQIEIMKKEDDCTPCKDRFGGCFGQCLLTVDETKESQR